MRLLFLPTHPRATVRLPECLSCRQCRVQVAETETDAPRLTLTCASLAMNVRPDFGCVDYQPREDGRS